MEQAKQTGGHDDTKVSHSTPQQVWGIGDSTPHSTRDGEMVECRASYTFISFCNSRGYVRIKTSYSVAVDAVIEAH